jgi:hypothetical protein
MDSAMSTPAPPARIVPPHDRKFSSLCEVWSCDGRSYADSGYCQYHASERYAIWLKWIARALKLIAWIVAAPLLITLAGLSWKAAFWVLLQ